MNPEYKCYICDVILNSDAAKGPINISTEHIIPNALGGRLKSKNLLCKTCNSKFGDRCDAELAKEYAVLTGLLMIERERGKIHDLTGDHNSSGRYVIVDGYKPMMASIQYGKIELSPGKFDVSIITRNRKEMLNKLKELAKQHPGFDVEKSINNAVAEKDYLSEPIRFELKFGNDLTFMALTKVATNYYMYIGGNKSFMRHGISLLRNERQDNRVTYYNPVPKPYQEKEGEVVHIIHLEGVPEEGLIYCYIQLLSSIGYIVELSREYTGEKFTATYAWDVIKKTEIVTDFILDLNKTLLDNMFGTKITEAEVTGILTNLSRLQKITDQRQSEKYIDDLYEQICMELFGQKTIPKTATDEMVKRFTNTYYTRIAPWLYKKQTGR